MVSLQLAKAEGVDDQPFRGVPLFQAESLCVRTPKARYTPLFFSKRDLDRAVANAFQQREGQKEADAQSRFKGASDDLAAARAAVGAQAGWAVASCTCMHAVTARASNMCCIVPNGQSLHAP